MLCNCSSFCKTDERDLFSRTFTEGSFLLLSTVHSHHPRTCLLPQPATPEGHAEPWEEHLVLPHPSVSGLPDRAFIHTRSLLFNLLLILGKNTVISIAHSIGIIFHPGSWLWGWVSAVVVLALQDDTANAWRADLWIWSNPGTRGAALATRDYWNILTVSESWTTDFKCFNFMHAFHYKSWPEAFLDKPSNQTILHRLLKSNFVLCQHKQFNLMFSLLSKHRVSFTSPLHSRTPLSIHTPAH